MCAVLWFRFSIIYLRTFGLSNCEWVVFLELNKKCCSSSCVRFSYSRLGVLCALK